MNRLSYGAKIIFFQEEDKKRILDVLSAHKLAWNECSKVRFKIKNSSIVELHKNFYSDFRKSQPEIPSQIIISAQRNVLSSFLSVRKNNHKIEKPPEKRNLSAQLDKRMYSYKNGIFSIISLGKRVKCSFLRYKKLDELLSKYEFCDPLIFEKDNEIWINFTFNVPSLIIEKKTAVGIDLGCRVFAATSEGNLYIDKKFNKEKRRIRFNKRKLKSKSVSSKSARRHLKKMRRKEANKNRNFLHHLSKKIIKDTSANVLVLENLKSIKVKKNKFENKNRISQISFFELKRFLTYKALLNEKTVIEVSPAWTSQIDHVTGKKEGDRKGRRFYAKSGKIYDSDINGAINIGLRSKLPVSQTARLTYGQANVNSPIVTQ